MFCESPAWSIRRKRPIWACLRVKQGSQSSPDTATNRGSFSGTPLYMSPEQASAYEDVDRRADIYSLGAVAYYLLTGKPPFTSKNVLELLAAHRNSEVAPPSRLNAAVPADLDQIILKCMAKNASERFQDADEMRNALEQCSCANKWGPQEAANWWRSLDDKTKPERKEQPESAIDATVEYLSNCAPPNRDMASKVKRAHPEPD